MSLKRSPPPLQPRETNLIIQMNGMQQEMERYKINQELRDRNEIKEREREILREKEI